MRDERKDHGSLRSSLLADSLSVYATQSLALILQLATGVVLARGLAPEGRGAYGIAVLIPVTIVSLGSLGHGMIITHLAARGARSAGALLGNALMLASVLGIIYGIGAVTLLDPGWSWLRGVGGGVLVLSCLITPPLLLVNYLEALLVGLGRLRERNGLRLLGSALLLCFTVALAALDRLTIAAAVAAYGSHAVILCAGMLLAGWRVSATAPALDGPLLRSTVFRGLRGAAGPACSFLLIRSDLFLVNWFLGPASAGVYAVAAGIASLLLMVPTSIGLAFLPRATRDEAGGRRRLGPLVCRLTVWLTLALSVLLLPAAPFLIEGLYGAPYLPSVTPLLILLPGVVVASLGLILASDTQARGQFHLGSIAAGLGLVVNVALNLMLIPGYGLEGAALASSIAYGLTALILLASTLRSTRVSLREMLLPRTEDLRLIASRLSPSTRESA